MPKKRKLGQKHTRLARASITAFLNEVEFATQEEIGIHLENDVYVTIVQKRKKACGIQHFELSRFYSFQNNQFNRPRWLQASKDSLESESRLC